MKAAFFLLDIFAILNRCHDRRIGRRPADTFLFQNLHKGCFCKARWGLGEVLFRSNPVQRERFIFLHQRQRALIFIVFGFLVAAFLIDL